MPQPLSLHFRIDGIIPSKKNSKRLLTNRTTGRVFVASSKRWSEFVDVAVVHLGQQLFQQCGERHWEHNTCAQHGLAIQVQRSGHYDLDNTVTSICDLLQDVGVLKDDASLTQIGAVKLPVSKNAPNKKQQEVVAHLLVTCLEHETS